MEQGLMIARGLVDASEVSCGMLQVSAEHQGITMFAMHALAQIGQAYCGEDCRRP